jgi:hypothetical protein
MPDRFLSPSTPPRPSTATALTLYTHLVQYPILARHIRQLMRERLYAHGIVAESHLEQEAHDKAIQSQHREGLHDPYFQEVEHIWEQRLQITRDYLTDFYFANNLMMDEFLELVQTVLAERNAASTAPHLTSAHRLMFNPELAPVDVLLRQARLYESLPDNERESVKHHLEEIVVVLTRTMISDQLGFVSKAKNWFTVSDFEHIQAHRIGTGKIGGKAAGMLLAHKILKTAAPELATQINVPRSYYLGADVFYDFKALNNTLLEHNLKYLPIEKIREEYDKILAAHLQARFPRPVKDRLRDMLMEVGKTPLIVRSSSLLEDNFGTSFAGKYASFFCPNQGTLDENLEAITLAIRKIYASVYSPDVLIYRRKNNLLDFDERMAILLQEVQGWTYKHNYFPTLAGVAFSKSPIVWDARLKREEGFVRLVLGLGTRAVERVGEDYPRLLFLSHPTLRPEKTPQAIDHYSQHNVDVISLKTNTFETVPIAQVLDVEYPALRQVASLKDPESETLLPLRSLGSQVTPDRLVLTFDNLLNRTDFVPVMKHTLATLSKSYNFPVDMEFAATLLSEKDGRAKVLLHLLQCRPQSSLREENVRPFPADLPLDAKLFQATRMVPQGQALGLEYVIYVDPTHYDRLPDTRQRAECARLVGRLNKTLEGKRFILVGPGRWGSSNIQLGVPVSYADIYNARALVELSVGPEGAAPDPSYGTHFFQDLVEAQIYSLAIYADHGRADMPGEFVNWAFLRDTRNALTDILPDATSPCLKVIHIPHERPHQYAQLLMDGEHALAYFGPERE